MILVVYPGSVSRIRKMIFFYTSRIQGSKKGTGSWIRSTDYECAKNLYRRNGKTKRTELDQNLLRSKAKTNRIGRNFAESEGKQIASTVRQQKKI
jgi:hypothetical protein